MKHNIIWATLFLSSFILTGHAASACVITNNSNQSISVGNHVIKTGQKAVFKKQCPKLSVIVKNKNPVYLQKKILSTHVIFPDNFALSVLSAKKKCNCKRAFSHGIWEKGFNEKKNCNISAHCKVK